MPGAGALDRRVTLSQPGAATGANALNEPVLAAPTVTTVWARRQDVSDGERLAAGQVGAHRMTRFVVRSTTATRAVTPRAVLKHEGKTYNILGIKETAEGRARFLEITAVMDAD
jgi:SPP1 family predicted phage head-tail adaptor